MQNTQTAKSKVLMKSFTNPLIRKLDTVQETSEDAVTLSGVANKMMIFLITIAFGAVAAFLLNRIAPMHLTADQTEITVSMPAVVGAGISLIFFILTPLLAFIIRSTIPVTGSLYCFSTGYIFSFLSQILPDEYGGAVTLALVLTTALVAALAFLYSRKIIQVTQKFRTIISALFITMVVSSLLIFIFSLIPGLNSTATFVMTNPVLSIAGGIVYIVIASAFLLVDFDTIERSIENRLPRKYEWYGAFSLAFSIIWLFLKVLNLILSIKDSSK